MADKSEEVKGKIPPQNFDRRKSLLGAVLIDEEVLADAAEIITLAIFTTRITD